MLHSGSQAAPTPHLLPRWPGLDLLFWAWSSHGSEVSPPYLMPFQSIQYRVSIVYSGTRDEEGLVEAWDSNRCSGQCD